MTLQEHIYAVKSLIDNGTSSQSNKFRNPLIAHYLKNARSLLLKRKLDKERMISQNNYQKFCMPLESSDYADCPDCNIPDFDCFLLRSTIKLPNSIRTRWGHSYIIRDILGNIIPPFNLTNNRFKEYSLTQSSNNLGWFVSDNYLYIITDQQIPIVLVESVFEDPEEITNLPICNNDSTRAACIDQTQTARFAIDAELVMPMYEMTLKLLGIGKTSPEDMLLNAAQPKTVNVEE